MPILFQHRIYREDLRNNPKIFYVFGDNVVRQGLGGQAGEMRGEPNALGVATKWEPSMNFDAFFSDDDYSRIIKIINRDLDEIEHHLDNFKNFVVFPSDGLGTGLSQLAIRAPKVNAYLERRLESWAHYHFSN